MKVQRPIYTAFGAGFRPHLEQDKLPTPVGGASQKTLNPKPRGFVREIGG